MLAQREIGVILFLLAIVLSFQTGLGTFVVENDDCRFAEVTSLGGLLSRQ
jgi:hypothetical protein